MRPVSVSIRVSPPPALAHTDPRPTARPPRPAEVARSTEVMTLPETGSMRTTRDGRFGSDRDRFGDLSGDRVDPHEDVVLVIGLPDGTGPRRVVAVVHPGQGDGSGDGACRQVDAHHARELVDPERRVVGGEPARVD